MNSDNSKLRNAVVILAEALSRMAEELDEKEPAPDSEPAEEWREATWPANRFSLSNEAKERLFTALADGRDDFLLAKEVPQEVPRYVRFNTVIFDPAEHKVTLMHDHFCIGSMTVPNLLPGRVLTLNGLLGFYPFTVT